NRASIGEPDVPIACTSTACRYFRRRRAVLASHASYFGSARPPGLATANPVRMASLRDGNQPYFLQRGLEEGFAPRGSAGQPGRRHRLASAVPRRRNRLLSPREDRMTAPAVVGGRWRSAAA